MFTTLFSDEEETKDDIISNVLGQNKIVNTKNYTKIKENYERALFHLKNGIFYDFFKYRRQLRKFTNFTILDTIQDFEIVEGDFNKENEVTIIIDCSIQSGNKKLTLEECTVKEAKKIIFDKLGISVSKQEICKDDEVLNNNRYLNNETVTLRQKRRSNKKN